MTRPEQLSDPELARTSHDALDAAPSLKVERDHDITPVEVQLPPPSPTPKSIPGYQRVLTPHGTERVIRTAPWYVHVLAAMTDGLVTAILGICLFYEKFRSAFAEGLALVILAGIAGVRVAQGVSQLRNAATAIPATAGPAMFLFAFISQARGLAEIVRASAVMTSVALVGSVTLPSCSAEGTGGPALVPLLGTLAMLAVLVMLAAVVHRSAGRARSWWDRFSLAELGLTACCILPLVGFACATVREIPVDLAPGAPSRAPCEARRSRCNGRVPEVCEENPESHVTRWHPMTQAGDDGSPAPCATRCAAPDGGMAHCEGVSL